MGLPPAPGLLFCCASVSHGGYSSVLSYDILPSFLQYLWLYQTVDWKSEQSLLKKLKWKKEL
jgi:hypothetical protein